MKTKLIGLVLAPFLAFAAKGQVVQDTVVVKESASVDTVFVKNTASSRTNILSVKDGVDTVSVKIGKRGIYVHESNDGNVSVWTSKEKKRSKKFHSHLSGFGLGVNTYFHSSWKMNLPAGYEDMDLNLAKSLNVSINFAAISQPIIGKKFAITAGVGTEWHNYRFSEDVTLAKNSDKKIIEVVPLPSDANVTKTKLTDWWLNIPVAFEFNNGRYNSFYFAVGAVGSVLINSHTKVVTKNDGDKDKSKVWNKSYLNPFRASLMTKIGYGNFGIYANYSLTRLFQDKKGPELYPFAAGITFNF